MKTQTVIMFNHLYIQRVNFYFIFLPSKMSLQKFKTKSYCVGGRHYSGTTNITGKRTPQGKPYLQGKCNKDGENKIMFLFIT